MSTIDRVRYYDGEFLRAFDFSDEQTYHMEMRRRLNRYLHLYGIVQGLQLSEDLQGTVSQVSILPGFAIDAFGREIYVFAPYTFGDSDITNNRISKAGNYDVWLHYSKTPSTPPSSGYSACNQSNQYTRWAESFSVTLLANPSTPVPDPQFTDDDTDNPVQDGVAVLLGTIFVDPASTNQFSIPSWPTPTPNPNVAYLGIIAQRIAAPIPYDASLATPPTPPFSFQNANPPVGPNTPLSPPISLEIEPNIFADNNLIVGPDFVLTSTATAPVTFNPPGPSFNASGNVKIAGHLFVQGNIYQNIPDSKGNPVWTALLPFIQQTVQQFLPEFLPFNIPVTVTTDTKATLNGGYAGDTASTSVTTSRIRNVTSPPIVLAYLSQIESAADPDFSTLIGSGGFQLTITNASASFPPNNQTGTVSVTWVAGPALAGSPPPKSAIDNFTVTGIVICFP